MSRHDDPSTPVVAADHHHSESQFESQEVVAVMDDHSVHCQNLGAHRHGRVQTLHHHHDLTCLIEAGANMVRPELAATVEHLRNLELLVEQVSRRNTEQAQELWDARQDLAHVKASRETVKVSRESVRCELERVQGALTHVYEFLSRTPAQGPWPVVLEQYQSWCSEEQEGKDRIARSVFDLLDRSILKDEKR